MRISTPNKCSCTVHKQWLMAVAAKQQSSVECRLPHSHVLTTVRETRVGAIGCMFCNHVQTMPNLVQKCPWMHARSDKAPQRISTAVIWQGQLSQLGNQISSNSPNVCKDKMLKQRRKRPFSVNAWVDFTGGKFGFLRKQEMADKMVSGAKRIKVK